ncbi:hypothetical protein D3C75_949770 [compost metagenome]
MLKEAVTDPVLDATAEQFITLRRMTFEQFLEATRSGTITVQISNNIQSPIKHT